eukprot:8758197-Pyramimonas_sp.AAC.1
MFSWPSAEWSLQRGSSTSTTVMLPSPVGPPPGLDLPKNMTHCGPAAQCTRTRNTRWSPCSASSSGAGLASRGRGTLGEGDASNRAPAGGPRGEAGASR